jgi:mono/diheme cytochrome c family protein
VLPALLALGLVVVTAACGAGGVSTSGDKARGKELFVSAGCGGCHTLADANTKGTIGPNLDDAFAYDREQGFKESAIQQVVAAQIRYPLEPIECPTPESQPPPSKAVKKCEEGSEVTPTGTPVMPANLVKGSDVEDVAAYVASVAGVPGAGGGGKITTTDGKQIFQQAGCVNCHTLKDAGATGTIGPNLDQAKPPKALVVTRVTNGKGAMPSFKGTLSPAQIQAVATYVSSAAG